MTQNPLHDIATWLDGAGPSGVPSVCSAHPMVLEASMRATLPTQLPLLIEATCNQVNQDGGYTGMTPKDFRSFVEQIAAENGFPTERIILAGDHLGPNPWKSLPAEAAMEKAEGMISAFAAAGFSKLHLDCSMRSTSTLRFRERNELERDLSRYGFNVVDVRDAPDRPGKEMVFLTQVRDSDHNSRS